jgi:hypothetical protein
MKTGKVTTITKGRDWRGKDGGEMTSWHVEFDNGDGGEASTKAGAAAPWSVGEVAEYEVTPGREKTDGSRWPDKITKVRPGGGGFGGGGSRGAPRNEKLICAQNAMSHATALVCAGKVEVAKLEAAAEKILAWVLVHGGHKEGGAA